MNDAFHPLGSGYEGEMFWYGIFNRWGELVFETTDPDVSWYGQDQAAMAPTLCPTACTATAST